MREILFRGFHPDENGAEKVFINGEWTKGEWTKGEWMCGNLVTYPSGVVKIVDTSDNKKPVFKRLCEVIPETVGQYTGLTDKNGKKIFEGDILKSTKAWYTVEFASGGYGLKPFGKGKLIPLMGHWNFTESEVEVIGNIHDTPELLEVEK